MLATWIGALALLTACGGALSPAPGSASPLGDPSASGSATPRPTAWPGNAIIGIEALGVADGEIRKGINDFSEGLATEDLALMRRAADGLAGVDVLVRNADQIEIFEPMRPLAENLRDTLPALSAAARDLRAAIDSGDAEGISSASARLIDALTAYTALQPTIARFVRDSIAHKRLLVR